MKFFIKNRNSRGATLVEALVSIFILTMGILPSLSIVLLANSLTSVIKNNLIAANLAQEGVEIVRAIRDENWFNNRPFDTGLSDGDYRVNWDSTSLLSGPDLPIKLSSQGIYNYNTGKDTSFKRKVTITKVDPSGCNCELRVVVNVTWLEKNANKSIKIESHLFNWK